jgi:hypothetical protein
VPFDRLRVPLHIRVVVRRRTSLCGPVAVFGGVARDNFFIFGFLGVARLDEGRGSDFAASGGGCGCFLIETRRHLNVCASSLGRGRVPSAVYFYQGSFVVYVRVVSAAGGSAGGPRLLLWCPRQSRPRSNRAGLLLGGYSGVPLIGMAARAAGFALAGATRAVDATRLRARIAKAIFKTRKHGGGRAITSYLQWAGSAGTVPHSGQRSGVARRS